MAAIFGQFPANFRFSGAIRGLLKIYFKEEQDEYRGICILGQPV